MSQIVITVLMFAIPLLYFVVAVILQSKKLLMAFLDENAELFHSIRASMGCTVRHSLIVVLAIVLHILLNGFKFVAFGCNVKSVVVIAMLAGALMLEFAVRSIKKQKS